MSADVVAPIEETARAAGADGARYDEDELYRRVSEATDRIQRAWEMLASADGVPRTSRHEVMARPVGLTASASLGVATDPEAREIRASVSTRVPLPGAKLSATSILSTSWQQSGSGDGELRVTSADGTLSLFHDAKPETMMSEPPLGALVFGADLALEWRGVRLDIALSACANYSDLSLKLRGDGSGNVLGIWTGEQARGRRGVGHRDLALPESALVVPGRFFGSIQPRGDSLVIDAGKQQQVRRAIDYLSGE